jgi:hypothetical protein
VPFSKFTSSAEYLFNVVKGSELVSTARDRAAEAGAAIESKLTSASQSVSALVSSSDSGASGDTNRDSRAAMFGAVREFAAEAAAAIDDRLTSATRSVSELASVFEGAAADDANYESLAALRPIYKLVGEAGSAIDDKTRTLIDSEIPELLGAAGGVGAGVVAGAGILSAGAASGTVGAAALTSGLATAGGLVGGGMVAGIGVVAAPAVVLTAAGVWAVGQYNRRRFFEAREILLQEALRKRDALLTELQATNVSNHERIGYLSRLVAQLQAAVENLQADIELGTPEADGVNEASGAKE